MALLSPSVLVLTHAMLQVEHGELLRRISEIGSRQIDVAATHLLRIGRPVEHLAHRTLGHVLHLPEVLVGRRYLDAATPTASAIEVETVRIGH